MRLILSWDIRDDCERDCLAFMSSEFGPRLQRLGVRLTDVWYTQAGVGPQIVVAGVVNSEEAARDVLRSGDYARLCERLNTYAENVRCRLRAG
jgi:hypothetical protein